MRVLLINNQHYPKGGAHVVYFNTAELLKKNGHDVFFFSTKDDKNLPYEYSEYFPKSKDYRNLSIISKLKSIRSFIYNKEAYQKINEYIKVIKPDVAHVHLFMGGLTVSVLKALKENNIPIVHSVHDYRLLCPAYTFLDKSNEICQKCHDGLYLRCALNKCSLENKLIPSVILSVDAYYRKFKLNPISLIDRYIFVSNFAKKIHIKFDLKYERISDVIYNIDINSKFTNQFFPNRYFLYYGRLSREKGIELLIDACKDLNLNLKIVGTGPLFEKLKNNIDGLQNIEILGYKKGDELRELIANSYFVCVPSEWYENNPLSIIESFTFGKPIIGSNIGGIPELIEDNRGILFDFKSFNSLKDALMRADSMSIEKYKYLSSNCTEFANKQLSESTYYNNLLIVYNKAINDRKTH